jgi:hypothetical protein
MTITRRDVLASGDHLAAALMLPAGAPLARPLAAQAGDVVNVRNFGAVGDGVADDTPAIQAAVDYAQGNRKGIVFLPAGRYRLAGAPAPGGDATPNGIFLGASNPYADDGRAVMLVGAGRATALLAGADGMVIVRCAGGKHRVADLLLSAAGRDGVWGLLNGPKSLAQTTEAEATGFNLFENLLILDCAEGVVQTPGPAGSHAYYNGYRDLHIFDCIRGIWLREGVAAGNAANRNHFANIRIGNWTQLNTGIQIDAGDTNTFVACHVEGATVGGAPNAIPTAIRIRNATTGGAALNNHNQFFGCTIEGCTRHIDNANATSLFLGCVYAAEPTSLFVNPNPIPLTVRA